MQINELPTIPQAPVNADVMAIEVNGITYKVSKQTLASAILGQIGASDNVVDVSHGGTGATTASAARTALGVTPANIGAVAKAGDTMTGTLLLTMIPFTDANDAETDLFSLRRYNSSTLNTPYSAGLTSANLGVIASYGGSNNMTQLCVPQGKDTMFVRLKSSGTWGDWQLLTQPDRRVTYSSTISVTGATIGSRVSNQAFSLPSGVTVSDVKGVYVSKVTDSSAAHVSPMFGSTGQLIVAVYAAKATVSADVEVTVVY